MERKAFLQLLAVGVATGSLTSIIEACSTPASSTAPSANFTLDLTQSANSVLNSSGGSVISNSVIVINNNGTFVALSDICTHQGCNVEYINTGKQLYCPCHGSSFSISGAVLSGPAPSPLKAYTVTRSGNVLTVKG